MAEATAFILPVAQSISDKLASLSDEQIQYGIDLKNMGDKIEAICAILPDAEDKMSTSKDISFWLRDLKGVVYDIDDLLDEIAYDLKLRKATEGQFSPQLTRYSASSSNPSLSSTTIEALLDKINDIEAKGTSFGLTKRLVGSTEDELNQPVKECAFAYEPTIIGRDEAKHEILSKILAACHSIELPVLPIVGMRGCGKTAMAKQVYADVLGFDHRLWVRVSVNCQLRDIIEAILTAYSGYVKPNQTLDTLSEALLHSLFRKSCFFVFDDVSMKFTDVLKTFKDLLTSSVPFRGVILITTTSSEVAADTATNNIEPYHLENISFEDSWSIFKELAFQKGEEENYPLLSEIGKSIIKRCCGIPLVIVTLGDMLRSERDSKEWQRINNKVESLFQLNDHEIDHHNVAMQLLKMNYDKLPSHLKPCFASLSLLYMKGTTLETNCILYMWSALGLLPLRNKGKNDIEDYGYSYLMELASRSLAEVKFQKDKLFGWFKMRDISHDLAMNIMGQELSIDKRIVSEFARHIIWEGEGSIILDEHHGTIRHIPLEFKERDGNSAEDFPVELLKAKKARTLRFRYKNPKSKSFLEGIMSHLTCLRILDFNNSLFEELPSSIGNLKHLRYLDLSNNKRIRALPETISKLLHLEHLNLRNCSELEEIPTGVFQLQSLRCLILTTRQESFVDTNFHRLSSLQYLWVGSCPRLKHLSSKNVEGLTSLRELHINDCLRLTSLPSDMRNLVSLEVLIVKHCAELKMNKNELQGLQSLRVLQIDTVPKMESIPDGIQSAVNSLEYLNIMWCRRLVQLPDWLTRFTSLREVVIQDCPRLWPSDSLQHFASHCQVVIEDCPYLLPSGDLNVQEVGLFCGVFPGDFEFEEDTLIQLWMAMELFEEPLERAGMLHLHCLLEEAFIKESRTDILSRKVKYKIDVGNVTRFSEGLQSKKDLYALVDDNNGLSAVNVDKCEHLAIASKSIDPATIKALDRISRLRTFLLISNYGSLLKQMPSAFFTTHKLMQILDLSGSHLSELPSSIRDMTLLRYLDLSFTLIERIPESIGYLESLQTLKLNGCKYLHVLPKGIINLCRLRYLDFDVLGQLTSMPKKMGLLTELRALSAFIASEEDGCRLKELKDLNNLCGSFCISGLEYASMADAEVAAIQNKHLTRLHLKWSDSKSYCQETSTEASGVLTHLKVNSSVKELKISYYPGKEMPKDWSFDDSDTKLVSVTLVGCKIEQFLSLEKLQDLKYLSITDLNRVTSIDHSRYDLKTIFCNLKTLAIDGMRILTSWTGVQSGDFPRLMELSVKRCPKLTKLDFLPLLRSLKYLEISHCKSLDELPDILRLTKLKTLMINNCPSLKERYSKEGNDWKKITHAPNIWIDMRGMGSANYQGPDSDSSSDDDSNSEPDCSTK